jgi:hypothetical protein
MIFDATNPDDIRLEGEEFGRHRRIDKRSREIKGPMTIFAMPYGTDYNLLSSLSKVRREAIEKVYMEETFLSIDEQAFQGLSSLEELQINNDPHAQFRYQDHTGALESYSAAITRILAQVNLKGLSFRGCFSDQRIYVDE